MPGRGRLGSGLGVRVAADGDWESLAHGAALEADLHGGEVEGIEDNVNPRPDQGGIDLEGIPV